MEYSQWVEASRTAFANLMQAVMDHLPSLVGALALVLLGWILARLLRGLTRRLAGRLDWLLKSRAVEDAQGKIGVERPAAEVMASIVFWAVLLFFLTAATETLGLPVIATWIASLSYYLPRILVGLLIVLAGLVIGNLAGDAVQKAAEATGVTQATVLGRSVQVAILLIAVVTAVEQLGVDTKFLTATITILIAAMVGGVALAFSLGARTHVGNLIASHYLRQSYRVGQTVRVAGVEGEIVELSPTAAILKTPEGRVSVPAHEFSEQVSVLVASEA